MTTSSPARPTIVILGASYAGLMACARLAHLHRQARIIVVANHSHFEQKIRLHESLAGQRTASFALAPLLRRRGLEFIEDQIVAIDPAQQQVILKQQSVLSYDYLVYALGNVPQQQLGGSAEHAVSLHNRTQVSRLTGTIRALAQQGGHITVLGGGLTAMETVTELAESFPGLKLSLISRRPESAGNNAGAQRHLEQVLTAYGITRHYGQIKALQAGSVIMHDNAKYGFDLCLDCTGMKASPVARNSQLATDELGRLPVDQYLRLIGHDRIFVAGDAARVRMGDDILRMSCATAMPMGAQAGANLAALISGKALQAFDFGYFARFTSLGRKQALTQFVDRADRPLSQSATGFWATRYKEWICQMTIATIKWELLTGLKLYYWPGSHRPVLQEQPQ